MPKVKFKDYSLYLIISQESLSGRDPLGIASSAISGGVDIIQIRQKNMPADELIILGKKLAKLCKRKNIIFIVNDDPFVAREVDACGVHMGQEDILGLPITRVREIIGPDKIIGLSTHSWGEFSLANEEPEINYIAFGPIFPTRTKNYFIGTKDVYKVSEAAKKPVFFVGGINLSNLEEILTAGGKNVALIRSILEAKDIAGQVRNFKQRLNRSGK